MSPGTPTPSAHSFSARTASAAVEKINLGCSPTGGASARPVEDDLAALPRAHGLEPPGLARLVVLGGGEAVGPHRRHVEPALEHGHHLVPGLEHLPAVHALEHQALEDDLVPVDGDRGRTDAEQTRA